MSSRDCICSGEELASEAPTFACVYFSGRPLHVLPVTQDSVAGCNSIS